METPITHKELADPTQRRPVNQEEYHERRQALRFRRLSSHLSSLSRLVSSVRNSSFSSSSTTPFSSSIALKPSFIRTLSRNDIFSFLANPLQRTQRSGFRSDR